MYCPKLYSRMLLLCLNESWMCLQKTAGSHTKGHCGYQDFVSVKMSHHSWPVDRTRDRGPTSACWGWLWGGSEIDKSRHFVVSPWIVFNWKHRERKVLFTLTTMSKLLQSANRFLLRSTTFGSSSVVNQQSSCSYLGSRRQVIFYSPLLVLHLISSLLSRICVILHWPHMVCSAIREANAHLQTPPDLDLQLENRFILFTVYR